MCLLKRNNGFFGPAIIAIILFSLVSSTYGAEEKRKVPAMGQKTIKQLVKAQKLLEEDKPTKSLAVLNKFISGGRKLNDFELAQLASMQGYIYYSEDNFEKAIGSFQLVLQQQKIPITLENSTRYQLSQLLYAEERFKESLDALKRWFKDTGAENAAAYAQMGQIYYQIKQHDKAIAPLEKAVSLVEKKGKPATESWYSLLRILYYQKEDNKNVARLLEKLVRIYPKREYWLQLSEIYGLMGKENKRLSTLDAAYLLGFVNTENRLLGLAGLYVDFGLPFKAANVIAKGLKDNVISSTASNQNFLANAWFQAQEIKKSILAMTLAAELSGEGGTYAALTSIYLEDERYELAVDSAKEALSKGGLKHAGLVWLDLGRALFNTGKFSESKDALKKAQQHSKSKKYASQWLKYVENELSRRKSLQAMR